MRELEKKIYIGIFLLIISIPFLCMTFYKTDMSVEKRYAQAIPKLMQDGKINIEYFDQWDDYVTDHFAFRQELSTIDAIVMSKIFRESNTEKVMIGREGWLYFQETLDDYLGRNVLNEREIHNCAKVISLMQERAEAKGCSFVMTVAPNKNSLYPDNMPKRLIKESNDNNFSNLVPELAKQEVHFVNLHEVFNNNSKIMYHKLDSHWNNEGATIACGALLDYVDKDHIDYTNEASHIEKNFSGDLKGMIYPKWNLLDDNVIYDREHIYSYVGNVKNTEDMVIETENPGAQGSVVMFRDSFGNALLPYVADEFEHGFFTKAVPFNIELIDSYDADTMILEVVERHIPTLISKVPLMVAPEREISGVPIETNDTRTTIEMEDAGNLMVIYGQVDDKYIDKDSDIYIEIEKDGDTSYFEAFPASYRLPDENTDLSVCYGLYVDKDLYGTEGTTICVISEKDNQLYRTGLLQIDE